MFIGRLDGVDALLSADLLEAMRETESGKRNAAHYNGVSFVGAIVYRKDKLLQF
jgi:hypothetical protein